MSDELDTDAAALLAHWASISTRAVEDQPLEQSRNSGLVNAAITGEPPEVWSVEDASVEGVDGWPVPVRIYRPSEDHDLPALVYSHGGGWTLLSIDSVDVMCRHLAIGARCAVVSVGYRLAPEHPFPAAFDDVWSVTRWVANGGLGWTPPRVGVGGDSAGGNLSAAVAVHARDTGAMRIDLQLLLYPAIELDLENTSIRELGNDARFRLTPSTLTWFWSNYLGAGVTTSTDPRAVPSASPSLAGVAPAHIVTGAYDPIKDEGSIFAAQLAEAGVDVVHVEESTLPHGFAMMLGAVPAAMRAFQSLVAATRRHLHPLPALAAEFEALPFGTHSAELQLLLHQMRAQPIAGKHFLFMAESQQEWALARYTADVPPRPVIDWSVTFTDLEAAEWHVFKIRWLEMFGEDLGDD